MAPDLPAAAATAAPTISVITVVYNGAAAIEATMASVLGQDWSSLEYVVVDGGSTDATPALVAAQRERLAAFVSEPDRGIYDAMNKGLALARGEWVLFMNCGDTFASPTALSDAARAAPPGGGPVVVFGGWLRRRTGQADVRCVPSLARGRFNHQAVLYSRALHRTHGGYVSVPGLGTADYLFFTTLLADPRIARTTTDAPIAAIDVTGTSAGLPTFSQKHAIDYLCGRTSRGRLLAVLALHPLYFHLKRLLRGAS